MIPKSTITPKMSHRGKGYDDGVNGLNGVPPHKEPTDRAQEEANKQYNEGWHDGSAVFKKKRKG